MRHYGGNGKHLALKMRACLSSDSATHAASRERASTRCVDASSAEASAVRRHTCRAHEAGECAASECSLLCNDLLRQGRSRFLIDPNVRLAYEWREAQDLGRSHAVGLISSTWALATASMDATWARLGASRGLQVRRKPAL